MKSQKQKILAHLKSHVGITPLTAYEKYGILRLSARIKDLRDDGHNIVTLDKTVKNRYGEKCRVAEYRLIGE